MKLVISLLGSLLFVLSIVTALDVVDTNIESSVGMVNGEEEAPQVTNPHKRMRRTITAVDASSPIRDEVIDPFNNYMLLAENEDALLRALKDKTSSIPPPKSKPVVSSESIFATMQSFSVVIIIPHLYL
jgi:hypothetical protein